MRIKSGEDIRWSLRHVHFRRNSDSNNEERIVRFVEVEEVESVATVKEVRTVRILSDSELAQKESQTSNSERKIVWREEIESSEASHDSAVRGGKRKSTSASRETKNFPGTSSTFDTPPESPKFPDTPPESPVEVPAPEVEEDTEELLSPYDSLEFIEEEESKQEENQPTGQQKRRKIVEINLFSDSEEEEDTTTT